MSKFFRSTSLPIHDLLPSLVVFLVALPLCLGIAIASGMEPIAGIITGIIGGILVGSISGSPLQVSGPAAGLAVIVWQFIERFGPGGLAWIVLIAGAIQISMGYFKLGQVFRAISPAIIQGMLAGIGTLIVLAQWHVMLDTRPLSSGLGNLLAVPNSVSKLIQFHPDVSWAALGLGICTIAVMLIWPKVVPRRIKMVPGSLIAVIGGSAAAAYFHLDVQRIQLPADVMASIKPLSLDNILNAKPFEIILASATLAFVASAESLLSAVAVDQMHNGPRANYDKELISQGVGNFACGILGALPMTGVIVRSGANVQAGAKTRASTIFHGFWLLVFVIGFPSLLQSIPVSVLAAVLILTGYKLLNIKYVKSLWQQSRAEVAIFSLTYLTIVFVDLLKGILFGLLAAAAKLLYVLTHLEVATQLESENKRAVIHLKGTATFLRLPVIAAAIDKIPSHYELHVSVDDLGFLDHACLELFTNTKKRFEQNQGKFIVEWEHLQNKFLTLKAANAGENV